MRNSENKKYKLKIVYFILQIINCILWISYGIVKNQDWFIIIPNALGLMLSCFQTYLWFKFRREENKFEEVAEIAEITEEKKNNSGDSSEELNKKKSVNDLKNKNLGGGVNDEEKNL